MHTLLSNTDIRPFLGMLLIMIPLAFIILCTRNDNQDYVCDSCQGYDALTVLRYTDGTIYNVCSGCTPTAQNEAERGQHNGALR